MYMKGCGMSNKVADDDSAGCIFIFMIFFLLLVIPFNCNRECNCDCKKQTDNNAGR